MALNRADNRKEQHNMSKLGYDDDQESVVEGNENEHQETSQEDNQESNVNVVEDTADERISQDAEGAEGEGEDVSGGDDAVGRRRESAKERRARAKAAKERDKQELEILRSTVARQAERQTQIERELIVTRISDLDSRLATAVNEANTYDAIFAKAITAKNGEDAAEAQKYANDAKARANQLKQSRDQLANVLQNPRQAPQEKPYAAKAREFLADKPWYNPASGDEDSLVVEALDKALMKRMNPETPEYWTELNKKVRKALPHKFGTQDEDDDAESEDEDYVPPRQQARTEPRRKGPPTGGSSRTSSGRGGPSEIRLPKEMVEAMKEAGHWDNPKTRERVAKRYLESVKNNTRG